jgi:hypothetical protein
MLEISKIQFEPCPRTYKCINYKLVKHQDSNNVVIILIHLIAIFMTYWNV